MTRTLDPPPHPAAPASPDDPATAALSHAARVLAAGGLVAFPTETVYGLGARARDPRAVARIFAAKGRPADHPLIVHLPDARAMPEWADPVPAVAWKLAEAFWPGPLTLILRCRPGVPREVTGGLETIGLRVPSHPLALALLKAVGEGIAAPSANRHGRVSPTCAEHVRSQLGDAVDVVLDGGPCGVGIESTIVDLSRGRLELLRPGAITAEDLARAAGLAALDPPAQNPTRAPGSHASHYAPVAKVWLATRDTAPELLRQCLASGARTGFLSGPPAMALPDAVHWLRLPESPADQARELYARLHEADRLGLQAIVAVLPEGGGLALALRDRLQRAAGLGAAGPAR